MTLEAAKLVVEALSDVGLSSIEMNRILHELNWRFPELLFVTDVIDGKSRMRVFENSYTVNSPTRYRYRAL